MNRITTNGGDTIQSLTQWQVTGRDLHSLVATPAQLFVNPTSDFHLLAGSPAVDAGTTNFAPLVDLDGNNRPAGAAVDIGAYERTVAIPGNTAPTNIVLSGNSVLETSAAGTVIGTLTATDTPGDSHHFTLLSSAGGRFALSGNQLVVGDAALFNYEAATSHTIQVRATDAGGLTYDKNLTVNVGNVNEVVDLIVQRGMSQRSYIRYVDVVFESAGGLAQLIAEGRVRFTRLSLTGTGGVFVSIAGKASVVANRVAIDFGVQGIGGNRNSAVGDGYYRVRVDADRNGSLETWRHFYRLLGDTNGDRRVTANDVNAIAAHQGKRGTFNTDVNGDGVVNATDLALARQQVNKALAASLPLTD
jgi:hypothetical protein